MIDIQSLHLWLVLRPIYMQTLPSLLDIDKGVVLMGLVSISDM